MRLCKMRIMYYCPVYAGHAKYVCSALFVINLNLNDLVIQDLQNPLPRFYCLLYSFSKAFNLQF